MKIVFIGGGAHRYLSVARSIMAEPKAMQGGELHIQDLDAVRAAHMGQMIEKTPECRKLNCKVVWQASLEESLTDADVVCVVLMAGGPKAFMENNRICNQHGFIGTDQLSPSGAMLAIKGGTILMDIARRMERLCPDAWLLDFANPVPVLSAAVNNHTKIKCLGVCAGYTNHLWDLPRLFGKDEKAKQADVNSAGINHMSYITGGTLNGRDVYDQAEEYITQSWQPPTLSSRWNAGAAANITNSVTKLVQLYRKYGVLLFSTEPEGLAYLDMAYSHGEGLPTVPSDPVEVAAVIDAELQAGLKGRAKAEVVFQSLLDRELTDEEWDIERPESLYMLREDQNIMVKIIKALAGIYELKIATSFPNRGAVPGFTDRTVLEYSQIISKNGLRAVEGLKVPDIFYGMTAAFACHQTLLGDAIATEDPAVLYQALYAYPVKQDFPEQKAVWKALLEHNRDSLPQVFQKTKDYLI